MTTAKKRRAHRLAALDLHSLLAERHEVAVIWGIGDVQFVRPDLDDDQAWKVLLKCERYHDCSIRFCWSLIESVADELFPMPSDIFSSERISL